MAARGRAEPSDAVPPTVHARAGGAAPFWLTSESDRQRNGPFKKIEDLRERATLVSIHFDVNHSRRDWLLAPRRPTCVGPRAGQD
jgi:hypothetical protein